MASSAVSEIMEYPIKIDSEGYLTCDMRGEVTGFLGSLKISRCEERRLEDTQNLKCEDRRLQNWLVLTTDESATKPED